VFTVSMCLVYRCLALCLESVNTFRTCLEHVIQCYMQHCMSPTRVTKTVMMQATNTLCIITDYTVSKNPACLYASSSNSTQQCLYGKTSVSAAKLTLHRKKMKLNVYATAHVTNMSNKKCNDAGITNIVRIITYYNV